MLALDLYIFNHNFSKIGYLKSKWIKYTVGNYPEMGGICLPIEVFQKDTTTILQFRGSYFPGKKQCFTKDIGGFIADSKFKEILILSSLACNHKSDFELKSKYKIPVFRLN